MAALEGFSAHTADIEVGHYLGLRWFHLDSRYHGEITMRHRYDSPVTAECGCGAMTGSPDERWLAIHKEPRIEPRLSGVVADWDAGENVGECRRSQTQPWYGDSEPVPHEVPAPFPDPCRCGFWAYWQLGERTVNAPAAVGIIKGYGNVIEGELGFRCSHAKIIALHLPAPQFSDEQALALENTYQAAVYRHFGAMLEMVKVPPGQPALGDPEGNAGQARARGSSTTVQAGGNVTFHTSGGMGGGSGGGGGSYAQGGVVAAGGGGGSGGSFHHSAPPEASASASASAAAAAGNFTVAAKTIADYIKAHWDTPGQPGPDPGSGPGSG